MPTHARTATIALAAILLATVSASCSDGAYSLVVRFSPRALAEEAVRIELDLIPSCAAAPERGGAPTESAYSVAITRADPSAALGEVEPGVYGLYGRAFDDACSVVAAGCVPVEVVAGGSGTFVVTLSGVDGPMCPAAACTAGRCDGPPLMDGGVEDDAGATRDGGPDGGPPDAGCVPRPPETCNANDDDCDGAIDEALTCQDNCDVVTRPDGSGPYIVCDDQRTWAEARAACQLYGYDLVIVDDAAENDWLASLAGPLAGNDIWLGFTRVGSGWEWSDGRPIHDGSGPVPGIYTNFAFFFPRGDGDCGELDESILGDWNDESCTDRTPFVCEIP